MGENIYIECGGDRWFVDIVISGLKGKNCYMQFSNFTFLWGATTS